MKQKIYEIPMNDKFNKKDFKQQKKVIDEKKTTIKQNNPPRFTNILPDFNIHNYEKKPESDKYDVYLNYLMQKGLSDDNETSTYFDIRYVNIDSSKRQTVSNAILSNVSTLSYNPLSLIKETAILTITQPNHSFEVGNQIVLFGLTTAANIIRISSSSSIFTFTDGSSYVKITYDHGIATSLLSTYDISDLTFTLSDFVGNNGDGYINNIPINSINKTHNLLLTTPTITTAQANIFYFELPTEFSGTYTPATFNVTLTFNYICGIPLNKINSNIPTSVNCLNPYLIITTVSTNSYTVILPKIAGNTSTAFGNSIVQVGKIDQIINSFPDPNQYKISLPTELYNIVRVEIFSSTFPCVPKNIPSTKNKFYWQNLQDGDHVYSVELDGGFYTPIELKNALEKAFYYTERVNYAQAIANETKPVYTNHNYIEVNIETSSGITTVKSFIESQLVKPFINVNPAIASSSNNDPSTPVTNYILTIRHEGHGLIAGTEILIQGAIEHMGIPTVTLNKQYEINEVLSVDTYTIVLTPFNLSPTRINTMGGANVSIFSPNSFKLRMDYSDSLCGVLGFRNIGYPDSITTYGVSCTNEDLYEDETNTNDIGVATEITKDPLDFISDSYLMIKCDELVVIENETESFFAKILLNGSYGSELYNTFVDTPKIYYTPIDTLSELTLSFYRPNGELFDFSKINHSFVLRIVCVRKTNIGMNIDTTIGIES